MINANMKSPIAAFLGAFLVSALVSAETTVIANQGAPGNQGSWRVSTTPVQGKIVTTDGGSVYGAVYVGTSVVSIARDPGTLSTTVTNSLENTGSPKVKCRDDGVSPLMGFDAGTQSPGFVLGVGDSATFTSKGNGTGLKCISDTVNTIVHYYQSL